MTKHVKMMVLESCPHCKKAFRIIKDLMEKHPEFTKVRVEVIEESKEPQKTEGYDYWYVPTFFVEGIKMHEGVPSEHSIENVFRKALS
ncbi:MAG TPA: thioredoxin family protein [Clostridiales bacterium]|nr:thioredoxin family protein [Clostridiales bacterium]